MQVDRIKRGVDNQAADDHDQWQTHQKRDGRAPPHEAVQAAFAHRGRARVAEHGGPSVGGIGHQTLSLLAGGCTPADRAGMQIVVA